jgi:hypothetical protein
MKLMITLEILEDWSTIDTIPKIKASTLRCYCYYWLFAVPSLSFWILLAPGKFFLKTFLF